MAAALSRMSFGSAVDPAPAGFVNSAGRQQQRAAGKGRPVRGSSRQAQPRIVRREAVCCICKKSAAKILATVVRWPPNRRFSGLSPGARFPRADRLQQNLPLFSACMKQDQRQSHTRIRKRTRVRRPMPQALHAPTSIRPEYGNKTETFKAPPGRQSGWPEASKS
jgi:hypothetical protein